MQGIESIGKHGDFLPWEGDGTSSEKKRKTKRNDGFKSIGKRKIEGVNEKAGKLAFDVNESSLCCSKDVMNKAKVEVMELLVMNILLDLNNLDLIKKTLTKPFIFGKSHDLFVRKTIFLEPMLIVQVQLEYQLKF